MPPIIRTPQRVYIGIDPGKQGGIAALRSTSNGVVAVAMTPMPLTERDIWHWLKEAVNYDWKVGTPFVLIERVGGYIGDGNKAPGSAMFNFGWAYGSVRMACIGNGIPMEEFTPQKWQKIMGVIRPSGMAKTPWKNKLKQKAQQLFPAEKITLATADALLIAECCRRTQEGLL